MTVVEATVMASVEGLPDREEILHGGAADSADVELQGCTSRQARRALCLERGKKQREDQIILTKV